MRPIRCLLATLFAFLLLVERSWPQESLWRDLDRETEELHKKGDHLNALRKAELAVRVAQEAFGPDDPKVAISLNNLGYMLFLKGDLDGAEKACRQALTICVKALGANHQDTEASLKRLDMVRDRRKASGGTVSPPTAEESRAFGTLSEQDRAKQVVEAATLASTELAKMRFAYRDLEKAHADLERTSQATKTELEAAKARVAVAEDEVAKLTKAFDAEKRARLESESTVEAATKDLVQLRQQLETERAQFVTASRDMQKLQVDLTQSQTHLRIAREDITRLQADVTKQQNAVAGQKKLLTDLQQELTATRDEARQAKARIAALDAELAKSTTDGKAAQNAATEWRAMHDEATNRLEAATALVKDLKPRLAAAETKVADGGKAALAATRARDKAVAEAEKAVAAREAAQKEAKELSETLAKERQTAVVQAKALEAARKELTDTRGELERTHDGTAGLRDQAARKTREAQAAMAAMEDLQVRLALTTNRLQEATSATASLRAQVTDLQGKFAAQLGIAGRLDARTKELEKALADKSAEFDRLKKTRGATDEATLSRIAQAEAARDQALREAAKSRGDVDGLRLECEALRKERDGAATALRKIETDTATAGHRSEQTQKALIQKDGEIAVLRENLAGQKESRDKAERAVEAAAQELANQKELAQQAARLLKEVRNDLAAVSQKEQDLRTKVEAAQRETESLRKQLADRIQEAQSLRKSDDSVALRTRIAELEKTLALADGERTALRAQIQTLKADAASNSGQAQMKAADLEAQQRRTAEAEAKLAEQLREAANVRRDLSNAKQDLESARAEATTLQRSFEALQGRWEAASTEVATLRTQAQRTTEVEGRLAKAETDLSAAQRRAEELQTSKTKAEADRDALKTKADGDARSRLAAEQETVGLRQEVERIRSAMDEQTKLFQQSQELWKTREKELLSRITTLGAGSTRTPDGVPVSDKLPLRTWQYANGISVQARFVLRSGPDIYVLEQADGTRVAVSRSSLSTDDQKYLDGVSPQK